MTTGSMLALAIASSGSANASIARKNSCKEIINDFNSDTATIEQAHAYADCVNYLYPKSLELSYNDIIGLKVAFVLSLIVGIVFFIKNKDSLFDRFLFFLVGITVTPTLIGVFYFILLGIKWVIS